MTVAAAGGVVETGDDTFADVVIGSPHPVLVEFGASWCTPCRLLEPVLHELAALYAGRLRVATVDSDASEGLLGVYQITSIPTLLLVVDGAVQRRIVGARPKPELRREIDALLAAPGDGSALRG